jgi:hypothetical protein
MNRQNALLGLAINLKALLEFNMRKIFWDNPYQHSLTTTVASVDGNKLLFEETIAYSFAGGQESDKAYVNGLLILDSTRENNLIYYTLADGHGLSKVIKSAW